MATLGIPQNTIEVLQKYNFNFQKKFGQNFLIDTHVLEKIIEESGITKDDFVLEIGPGIGTMTQYLCENAREVAAVEIDKNLIPILADTLSAYDNVEVINDDILKVDINKLAEEKNGGKPIKVVANLPYYITTPIIMGLFESHVPIDSITIMVQKEVADRMQVGPGTKEYGALSLAVQYYAKPEIVAIVPPNCFMPRPNVGSAVIRLTRHKEVPVQVNDEKLMFKMEKILSKHYHVLIAKDGLEALNVIKDNEIDIIISDVMMPEMDGLEFCRTLKSNLETSHIPIILLTAKNTVEDRIECYNAGADGYISKPFELKILEARINNFIMHKKNKQEEFRSNVEVNIDSLEPSSIDKEFLDKVISVIKSNMSEGDFDVVQLADALAVSKSSLYRKMKIATGLSPIEFIRNIRLKHGSQLLKDKSISVAEVAYECGFSNPKYFATCFKEEFGVTPKEYQKSC